MAEMLRCSFSALGYFTYPLLWAELCQSTMQRVSLVQTPEAIAALLSYDEASEEARGPPHSEGEWG